ncbi:MULTISPECIES: nuclear transport factor 2 family protein [unclassified Streptomyces]|uniref:nuclear transport factor 2 family protein n=1 Tax=unclassified Streptomyces TaxID=2593676 RepID=UPI0022552CA1|nr:MULTISPECIES: nuclear transport factor 2 family protein [unclassified Streptomyces]MCX4885143.1 nuclear transport factor 2 family protein [Streptomyces sp. NBC_00847]MCX5425033.1 nuclear transport factor 2 family protein [Streptomyces sp. NBC_00078]
MKAEREIYRTFYTFFRLVDTGRYRQLVECFTKDTLIEYDVMAGPTQRFHGRDDFAAFVSAGRAGRHEPTVAHVVGQTLIEWTDGRPQPSAGTVLHQKGGYTWTPGAAPRRHLDPRAHRVGRPPHGNHVNAGAYLSATVPVRRRTPPPPSPDPPPGGPARSWGSG